MESQKRIASSEMMDVLFGDTTQLQKILENHAAILNRNYAGKTCLSSQFSEIPGRIICVCPMVLCRALLSDLRIEAPEILLGGLGVAMYSISTYDDVVDERPKDQGVVASLIYSGNIASLYGLSLLWSEGYPDVAKRVVHLMNLNHCFQTDIVFSLWTAPADEAGYLDAISHTGYWASIGTVAAVTYASRSDLDNFATEFAHLYGRMCQIYDDIREIDDDLRNGYFSLPISIAIENGYDLADFVDRRKAVVRPKRIAEQCFKDIQTLCNGHFPALLDLAGRMHLTGQRLALLF